MIRTPIERHVDKAAGHARTLLRSRYGLWALGCISFAESALIVPIITDPFLVAYILADKARTKKAVLITTVSSVLGGVFAYVMALAFYEFIAAQYLVGSVGEQFYTVVDEFQNGIFFFTLLGAFTPVPYTLVALAAGFVEGSLFLFVLASVIGRLTRYGIVGYLTYHIGEKALLAARKRIMWVTLVCLLLGVAYLLLIKM